MEIRDSMTTCERLTGVESPEYSKFLPTYAAWLDRNGKRDEAEAVHRRVLAIRKKALGPTHPGTMAALSSLGRYLALRRNPEAESVFRELVAARKAVYSGNDASVADALHRLADVMNSTAQLASAIFDNNRIGEVVSIYEEIIAIRRKEPNASVALVNDLNELARMKGFARKHAEAETIATEAIERARALGPAGRPALATALIRLEHAAMYQDKFEMALAAGRESLEVYRQLKGIGEWDVHIQLGLLHERAGKFGDAEKYFRDALEFARSHDAQDTNHFRLSASLAFTGSVLLLLHRFDTAEELARECVALREQPRSASVEPFRRVSAEVGLYSARSILGAALAGQGKFAAAERLLLPAHEALVERQHLIMGENRRVLHESFERVISFCEASGRSAEAVDWKVKLRKFEEAERFTQ